MQLRSQDYSLSAIMLNEYRELEKRDHIKEKLILRFIGVWEVTQCGLVDRLC